MFQYAKGNSQRQVPKMKSITTEKDYCDLLYAWIQCNSERVSASSKDRKIDKKKVKWQSIEKDFTRHINGEDIKVMGRKAIAKYFKTLIDMGLIYENENDDQFYYITLLETEDASLLEYHTLEKLMNVLQKRAISIYVYLYSRFCANSMQPYIVTMSQIKEYIGVASSTTSNNHIIADTFEILKRLGLMEYELTWNDNKSMYQINWVHNELPVLM